MARFASKNRSVRAFPYHLFSKLALVRILVTRCAGVVLEMERQDLVGTSTGSCFVAIGTGHGGMRARQRETGVAMFRNGVGYAMPILHHVAIFAAILEQRAGELVIVRVFVAIRAAGELHFVKRVFASRNVAIGTVHLDVSAF